MHPRTLDHVGIAVASLDDAIPLYQSLLDAESSPRERVETQGVEVAFIGAGPGRVELIAPLGGDSAIARFLRKRGPGLHHLAYRVPDLQATLELHLARGDRLVDHAPRPGAGGHLVAFLHPSAGGGVLIELVEARDAPGVTPAR